MNLGELVHFENGDRSSNYPRMADNEVGGIPFVSASDVSDRGIDLVHVRRISVPAFTRLRAGKFREGDILYCLRGTIGKMARVPADVEGAIASSLVILRANDPTVLDFVYYYLASAAGQSAAIALDNGSAQPNLSVRLLSQMPLTLPPADELPRIVRLLRDIDDKVELNRRMNETLQEAARAIFRDWFVDFGPTCAKMARAAPYLSEHLWALFPNQLDEDGKPEGWSASSIGEEVSVVGGSTPSTREPEFWDGQLAWVTPKDLSKLEAPVLLKTERTITERGLSQISSGLLPVGTVLLSSRAPIGYLAVTQVPCAVNQGFIAMDCNGRISNVFAWLWVGQNLDLILQHANGSTFQEISKRNFRPLPMTVPPEPLLGAFEENVRPIFARIVANEEENSILAQTRDLLLPKLMSGETRVKEAQRVLEAAE